MFKIIVLTIIALNIVIYSATFNKKIEELYVDKIYTANKSYIDYLKKFRKSRNTTLACAIIWFILFLLFM